MKIHLKMDVANAIRNKSFSGFTCEDGKPATRAEAKAFLMDHLDKGHRFIPICDPAECPNFDFLTGCPGHPTKSTCEDCLEVFLPETIEQKTCKGCQAAAKAVAK